MAKTQKTEIAPLGESWSSPATIPGTDARPGKPIACFTTTYTFSAEFLETELLPRFLGLEFDPAEREPAFVVEREDALEQVTVAVLVDQNHVDSRQTTLRWDQIPIRVPRGIQHAKVTVLAWERLVRLIVGSANLTVPGYRHNREVVSVLDFFDDQKSPPRFILADALDFLGEVLDFAAAENKIVTRVQDGIKVVTSKLKKWSRIPEDFSPLEYPKVYFVANQPKATGGVGRSVLKQVKKLWGSRSARDIRVVTPFVGDPHSKFQTLVAELTEIPHLVSADVTLAVPGIRCENDTERLLVMLPRAFRDTWAEKWEVEADDLNVCIVTPEVEYRDRVVQRPLHAKGLFLGDNKISLLCCGSSNFSASGMGVGNANIEANLVYLDRPVSEVDNGCLENRLPVDWGSFADSDVEWPDEPPVSEADDELHGNRIPPVFLWASLNPAKAELIIGLDPDKSLPQEWSLRLHHAENSVLASNDQYPTVPVEGRLTITLPSDMRGVPITTLKLRWRNGQESGDALIPVHVDDRGHLPPAEALGSLTAEGILACILSGCSTAEWVDRELSRKNNGGEHKPLDPALDPHRFHDPSGLALYRVRRLGRALTTMGRRLRDTVRTSEAVEYQVHRHPLGPMQLAEALVQETNGGPSTSSNMDQARLIFSLLETALLVAHAGKAMHQLRQSGEKDHRPCFRRAVSQVLQRVDGLVACFQQQSEATATGVSNSLLQYRKSVKTKADELLHGLYLEDEAPCQ
jgi:hypothetical protein